MYSMQRRPTAEAAPNAVNGTAAYLQARQREGRLLSDAVVAGLPDMPRNHQHSGDWRKRADSSSRLLTYLRDMPGPLTVIDLGCGNGWLANRIANLDGTRVCGVDTNAVELDQARRVFGCRPNLEFVRGDILDGELPTACPDVVVLASVVQYVPEPAALIETLVRSLAPGGEVHVVDSPIYQTADIPAARERTRQHYESIGVPEMSAAYHHHSWDSLGSLAFDVLYRPDATIRRAERRLLMRPRSSFPWIRICAVRDP